MIGIWLVIRFPDFGRWPRICALAIILLSIGRIWRCFRSKARLLILIIAQRQLLLLASRLGEIVNVPRDWFRGFDTHIVARSRQQNTAIGF